jgi:SAM-dependent methyltransferase
VIKALDLGAVPAPFLRYRVDGSADLQHFLAGGKRIVADMEAALRSVGSELSAFGLILDFGCGCGRVLRWLRSRAAAPQELYGTDIDAQAIGWCQAHLGAGRFATNAARPPLALPGDRFDFAYAISVFTHLREDYQHAWLEELARVTRPGGTVLLTVHGPTCSERLGPDLQRRLLADGFLFHEADSTRALFPPWYRASYQTPDYIRAAVERWFTVLGQIPRGLGDYQDIVLLQKRSAGCEAGARERLAG